MARSWVATPPTSCSSWAGGLRRGGKPLGDRVSAGRRGLVQPHPLPRPGARRVACRRRGRPARRPDAAPAAGRAGRSVVITRPAHGGQPGAVARETWPMRRRAAEQGWRARPRNRGSGTGRGRRGNGPRGVRGRGRGGPARSATGRRSRRPASWQPRFCPAAEQMLARDPLPPSVGARREAELYMATARAHAERVRGRTKPETWAVGRGMGKDPTFHTRLPRRAGGRRRPRCPHARGAPRRAAR